MFQSFENKSERVHGPTRLSRLRDAISQQDLQGFIIPRADRFQGEYVTPRNDRLAWLTGFTGSAGFAIALPDICGVFVDSRYRVQVKSQTEAPHFTPVDWPETSAEEWLIEHAPKGTKIGFDPWLHTVGAVRNLRDKLAEAEIALCPVPNNLVDTIWPDQPADEITPATAQPIDYAGESAIDKRARLAADLRKNGLSSVIITLPDSLCWLLNMRGEDVAHNPIVQAFGILHDDGTLDLFADPAKFSNITDHLGPDISVRSEADFPAALKSLTSPVQIDPKYAAQAIADALTQADIDIKEAADPCLLPKAHKNPTEIAGMAAAHLRDGAVMCAFLDWLDQEAPKGNLTEITVAEKLEEFRRATNQLKDISFETISASGPNAALPHYRVSHDSDRRLQPGEMMLVDSGGQYQDGTTDITRTMAIGDVPDHQKRAFTRVLQGMIGMSRLIWPKGLAGRDIDAIARAPLWQAGQDYGHGTGHGVGAYLSVHEGPASLSRRGDVPLEVGMILSNEPGYYLEGEFGVRIENLLVVEEAPDHPDSDGRAMLCFRTLTFTPIDTRLIDTALLNTDERGWLNTYHAEVLEKLRDRVSGPVLDWLTKACAPI